MQCFPNFTRKLQPAFFAIAAGLILCTAVVNATTCEAQDNVNATKAKVSAQETKNQAGQAKEKAGHANAQRDEVQSLLDKLAAKEQQLQRTLYASHMNLAQQAWEAGGVR